MIVSNGTVELSILEGSKWVNSYLMTQARDLAKNAILFATNFFVLLFTSSSSFEMVHSCKLVCMKPCL